MRHSRSDWAGVGKGVSEGRNTRRSGGKAAFVLFMCLINFRLCCCENEVWKCNRRTVCGKLVENRPSKSVASRARRCCCVQIASNYFHFHNAHFTVTICNSNNNNSSVTATTTSDNNCNCNSNSSSNCNCSWPFLLL